MARQAPRWPGPSRSFSGCLIDSGTGYLPLGAGEITVTYVCCALTYYWPIALPKTFFCFLFFVLFWRLATAIAMGITASAPFDGVDDENLAIAYISTLILVFFVRLLCPDLPTIFKWTRR